MELIWWLSFWVLWSEREKQIDFSQWIVTDRAQLSNMETVANSMWSLFSARLLLCVCALVWTQSSTLFLWQPHTSTQKEEESNRRLAWEELHHSRSDREKRKEADMVMEPCVTLTQQQTGGVGYTTHPDAQILKHPIDKHRPQVALEMGSMCTHTHRRAHCYPSRRRVEWQ